METFNKRSQFKRNEIKDISKENKDKLYTVICFNYCDKQRYYLKNGIIARNTVFNDNFDFARNKTTFGKLNKEGIYQLFTMN